MINDQKTMDISQQTPEPVHHESKHMTIGLVVLIFLAIVCCFLWFYMDKRGGIFSPGNTTQPQTLDVLRTVSVEPTITEQESKAALAELKVSSKAPVSKQERMQGLSTLNK